MPQQAASPAAPCCGRRGNCIMKRLSVSVGALILLGLMTAALAYAVPAAWVAQRVGNASGGRVQLAHASGLWHHGSAILVLSSGTGGADAVHWTQRLQWDVTHRQWPAQWVLQLDLPELGPPLPVTLTWALSGWRLDVPAWRGIVPLTALAGLGAPFNTLALEGDAQVALSPVTLTQDAAAPAAPAAPNLEIHIARLRSALAQGVTLGDYQVLGKIGNRGGTYELRTLQGELQVSGNGQCEAKTRLACNFQGTARAARQDDALIGNLLGLLGKQQPQSHRGSQNPATELRW